MKSHLKEVGGSGQVQVSFSALWGGNAGQDPRGLGDPRFQGRQVTLGEREGLAPRRNSSSAQ